MLPAQRNKVDIASLSEEEQKLFRLYGKLPNRKDVLGNKLKERKYFDSGDYALSKAGKQSQQAVGTAIPNPETIPHASTVSSSPGVPAPVGVSPNGYHHHQYQQPQNRGSPPSSSPPSSLSTSQQLQQQQQQTHVQQGFNNGSSPIAVPNTPSGLGNRQPAVSSFPTATGTASSPQGKESSSLGRGEPLRASDAMEE
ncbi:unnamed protein product [Sympodiomycopsis kandeliae]